MLNSWQGIGNLGKDPESRTLSNGNLVVNFTVAVNETYIDKSGEKKELVEWINIAAFGKLADLATKHLRKGKQVYVEGKIKTEKWEKDGKTQYATKIVASRLLMLGSNPSESTDDKAKRVRDNQKDEFDDDLPF